MTSSPHWWRRRRHTCGVCESRTLSRTVYDVLPIGSFRQVHNDGFPATAYDDPLGMLIGRWIDLLMRNEGRDEQEVTRLEIDFVLQPASPPHLLCPETMYTTVSKGPDDARSLPYRDQQA